MNHLKYDTWYSLEDMGDHYECGWAEVPYESKGFIKVEQEFKLRGNSRDAAGKAINIFCFATGEFKGTHEGTNIHKKEFMLIDPKPTINQMEVV